MNAESDILREKLLLGRLEGESTSHKQIRLKSDTNAGPVICHTMKLV